MPTPEPSPELTPPEYPAAANQLFAQVAALPCLTVPAVRPLRRELSRQVKAAAPEAVLDLSRAIIARSTAGLDAPDLRWAAFELIHYHPAAMARLDCEILEELGETPNTWDSVDSFALYLSGPAWRQGQVSDSAIHRWAESSNLWRRRAALVSTVALNNRARGGRGDLPRTLAVCRRLAADRDDMVVKAISWALRAVVNYDPPAVADFLAEYNDILAARVRREVRNKLTTGRKNPPR